ncbi:MAG: hypothetical protein ACI857_001970 [Arenicella sp.]|jgi:hypothetical protein
MDLYAQNSDLDQFYRSTYAPNELNRNSAETISQLYKDFRNNHKETRNEIDEKKFVYENNYFLDHLNRSGKIFYGDEISAYLNELKDWIIEDSNLKSRVKVYLTDYAYLNAFTNDFGNIYVNIASVAKLNSEEELLFLLAHEISHVMLEHSYNREAYIVALEKSDFELDNDLANFKVHSFSRKNELQADSMAHILLEGRVSPFHESELMYALKNSENPAIVGGVNLDLLIGKKSPENAVLHDLWEGLEVEITESSEGNDSLKTHPSIEKRIEQIDTYDLDSLAIESYESIGEFDKFKELSQKVLLNTYIESDMFVEGLHLVLKMREVNPKDPFLVQNQLKILTLIAQKKYDLFETAQFYDGYNGQCDDLDYLRLRKFIYTLNEVDWNIICMNYVERISGDLNNLNDLQSRTYEVQYKLFTFNNKGLFFTDSSGIKKYYEADYIELSPKFNLDTLEIIVTIDSLLKEDQNYVEKSDSSCLIAEYVRSHTLDEYHLSLLNQFDADTSINDKMVDPSDLRILIHPAWASKRFKRGEIHKANNFDPSKKVLLFESSVYYFKSEHQRSFEIDYEKTVELESQLEEITKKYSQYYQLNENEGSNNKVTVKDSYTNKIIQIWIQDRISASENTYSRVDEQFQEFVLNKNIEYLAFTICLVNRNTGRGTKYNLNYYEIYFDIKNQGVCYISKIGSRHNPDIYQLEQLVYLSNISKSK